MEPIIFTKMLRNLSEKLVAKFPATAVAYFRVKIAHLDAARLQTFLESGCLSFSQLRLDHWSVALVCDVTPAFSANYYAGRPRGKNMSEFVASQSCSAKTLSR